MNSSSRILLGLVFGLGAGIFYSTGDVKALVMLPNIIEPIGTLWINAIRMTVVPLVVALLVTSIVGQEKNGDKNEGELATRIGVRTIGLFLVMIALVCLYTVILAPPLLSLLNIDQATAVLLLEKSTSANVAAMQLPSFQVWLVNLIPTNPLKAAVDTAMLPLLIFTGLFSVALTKIEKEKSQAILNFFVAIRDAMFVIIGWVMLIAPVGIFALVFPLAARMGLSAVTALGSFVVIVCAMISLMVLLLYPIVVVLGRISFREFAKAVAPVQVIGFSTRSSLASLPATIAATEVLGLSTRISGLVLPVAVALFKFASPIARTTGTYFIAQLYGIELGATELIIVALAIGLLSFYSPGIPSGGLLIMTPVYISLGLPVEGIGLLIAVDLIVDMFITAANVTANVTATVLINRLDQSE